ncbi:MAG: DUF2254 domain-containing protein [Rhodanobacter sp.]
MNVQWRMLVLRITRRLWFRSALYGLLAVATALVGTFAKVLIPSGLATQIGAAAVGNILGILASSMLAVTTFSLSTMVSAYAAASSNATPRASTLLIEDSGSQQALATFIGAFLFSIVGLIALSTGVYGDSGRLILFAATIIVILMIVVTLLRWIDHLSRLGRVTETIDRAERATRTAMQSLAAAPRLHAAPYGELPDDTVPLCSSHIGYVTYIDVGRLQHVAEEEDLHIWADVAAGSFVVPKRVVCRLSRHVEEDVGERIANAFVVEDMRNFDQDPLFGMIVLTEIAQRALSPAINDPGTATDVIGTVTRLLCNWAEAMQNSDPDETRHDRVHIHAFDEARYFTDVFGPLARDSSGMLEVTSRLQQSLATLGQLGYAPYVEPAAEQAERALQFSAKNMVIPEDVLALREIAHWRASAT